MTTGSRWKRLTDIELERGEGNIWRSELAGDLKDALTLASIAYRTHWYGNGSKTNSNRPFLRILVHPEDAQRAEQIRQEIILAGAVKP